MAHAELRIGDSVLMISEENPDWGALSAESTMGSPVRMALYVADVDTVFEGAVRAGARVVIPLADQFYGDRSGRIKDPFGHSWILATHLEDVDPEEMQQRFEEFLSSQPE